MDSLDNLQATELRLAPPGAADSMMTAADAAKGNKRLLPEAHRACLDELEEGSHGPAAKAQVVGWPPVRSFRRNNTGAREAKVADENAAIYVKVGMDGAPYLRKIDLRVYQGYKDLRGALEGMFKCYSSLEEGGDGPEYVITYEDKDGDWMMVGDVPWEMFISSCKRLRIMKGSDARGLASSQ